MLQPVEIMIGGMQKAGTTSLKEYLGAHPDVATHFQTEFSYFADEEEHARGYGRAFRFYFGDAPTGEGVDIRILAKHATLVCSRLALRRLREHNPECRLIVSLRDPADRAYSSYLMERREATEDRPFTAVIRACLETGSPRDAGWRGKIYIGFGEYVRHLSRVLDVFERDQLHVMVLEEFARAPEREYRRLTRWLGLGADFLPDLSRRRNPAGRPRSRIFGWLLSRVVRPKNRLKRAVKTIVPHRLASRAGHFLRRLNRSGRVFPPMDEEARALLDAHYAPYNRRLEELLGRDLEVWRRR